MTQLHRIRFTGAVMATCVACCSARVAAQAAPTVQEPATAPASASPQAPAEPAQASPPPASNSEPAAAPDTSEVTSPPPGDLDAAADTVAEVASANDAESAELSTAELEALGLGSETAFDDSLKIYGFAAFMFMEVLSADRQFINQFLNKEGTFFISDLNVYLSKNISERWRTMVELRLTYAPNGRVLPDGNIEPNQSYDQGLLGRPANWGGVNIERAYLEYDIHPNITIQGGAFLTPYGVWNVDHGAPAIIPVVRPYVLVEQLFPERQAGLHVYGRIPLGNYVIGYHATVSNGRGYFDQFRDLDDTKAFGGRLVLETPWLGSLRFGASIYQGRFVDRDSDYRAVNPETGELDNMTPKGMRYDELAVAGDILWQWKALHFQAELIGRTFSYLDGARAPDGAGFRPDSYSMGGYALIGYRFPFLWNVMPFFFYQRYQREESSASAIFSALENYQTGLNFRPLPTLVLKIQWGQSWVPGGKPPIDEDMLNTLAFQAAWVF